MLANHTSISCTRLHRPCHTLLWVRRPSTVDTCAATRGWVAAASGPNGQGDCYRNGFRARWMMNGCDRGTGWSNARNVSWSCVCHVCAHACVCASALHGSLRGPKSTSAMTINCTTCSPFHLCLRCTRLVQASAYVCGRMHTRCEQSRA